MYSIWTSNLKNEDEKENFRRKISAAKPVLDRLRQLLAEQEKTLDASERSLESYETPSWAYRQAHQNGFRSCLYSLNKLINLDQQKETNQ